MDEMEEACDGVEYIRIDGDTPVEKRQNYVDEFQSENSNIKASYFKFVSSINWVYFDCHIIDGVC